MNKTFVEKVIHLNHNHSCPEFTFENPLLDKNVAKALSKSIIKILTNKQQSNVNLKVKHCVLGNLRKICFQRKEGHICINDDMMETLLHYYNDISSNNYEDDEATSKNLNTHLMKSLGNTHITSNIKPKYRSDVAQALINLNPEEQLYNELIIDTVNWDNDKKNLIVLKYLWMNLNVSNYKIIEYLPVIAVPILEQDLLCTCTELLSNKDSNIEQLLINDNLRNLIKKCSAFPKCFQIVSAILNCLLVTSNFDIKILKLIKKFIESIKLNCVCIASLYPVSIQSLVLMLDIDVREIPPCLNNVLVKSTLDTLKQLQSTCENNLIMLLSHYPQWFSLYTNKYMKI